MPRRPREPSRRSYRARIGYEGEYYLMKKFTELCKPGFYAVRTPGSGTGKVIKPDILAVDDGELYAIEVKSTNKSETYVPVEQLERLMTFTRLFEVRCPSCGKKINPRPIIAVRFLRKKWVFKEITKAESPMIIRLRDEG